MPSTYPQATAGTARARASGALGTGLIRVADRTVRPPRSRVRGETLASAPPRLHRSFRPTGRARTDGGGDRRVVGGALDVRVVAQVLSHVDRRARRPVRRAEAGRTGCF